MRKFAFTILVFAFCIIFNGCAGDSSSTYYFNIIKTSFVCSVGDSIDIFDEEINSNITTYEHMHIYSENTKVAKVLDNKSISILSEGEVTIIVSGVINGQSLSDSFKIIANNSSFPENPDNNVNEDEGDDSSSGETNFVISANKVFESSNGDEKAIVYKILSEDIDPIDLTIKVENNKDKVLISKVYDCVEVTFKVDDKFSLNILYKNLNTILTINVE